MAGAAFPHRVVIFHSSKWNDGWAGIATWHAKATGHSRLSCLYSAASLPEKPCENRRTQERAQKERTGENIDKHWKSVPLLERFMLPISMNTTRVPAKSYCFICVKASGGGGRKKKWCIQHFKVVHVETRQKKKSLLIVNPILWSKGCQFIAIDLAHKTDSPTHTVRFKPTLYKWP